MRSLASVFCVLVLCLVLSSGAWGDSIAIQNASFQTTFPLIATCGPPDPCLFNFSVPPGWSSAGGASAGSFEPSSAFFSAPFSGNGNIVAYTNGGGLFQILTTPVLANSIYTLSVDVGRRFDVVTANYNLLLLDGSVSNVLCSTGGTPTGSFAAGTFVDVTLTCATGSSVTSGFLGIELLGDARQVDFDNVRLDVVTSSTSTPEPGASVLMLTGLGVVGLLFARSRRNQHLQGASS